MSDFVPIFTTSIVDTGGNLPPVSTTPGVPVTTLLPVSLISVANLPPVLVIPVLHLDLQISPQIFKKFGITLMLFEGLGGR